MWAKVPSCAPYIEDNFCIGFYKFFICTSQNSCTNFHYYTLIMPFLIVQVPSDLDFEDNKVILGRSSESTVTSDTNASPRSSSRMPSKLMMVSGLLLMGGIVCFARCHSSIGAKLAVACILQKFCRESNTKIVPVHRK